MPSRSMFTITYVEGHASRTVNLPVGETLVGRASTCDLTINAPTMSRKHARFHVLDRRLYVRDLGSTSGTYCNGELLNGEAELAAGDELQLGDVTLRIGHAPDHAVTFVDHPPSLADGGTIVRPVDRPPAAPAGSTPALDLARLVRLFSELGRTLVAVQPLPDVLATIVDLVFQSLPAQRAFLMLNDAATGDVAPAIARGRDGSVPAGVRISRTVLQTVMRDRVAMLSCDALSDPRLAGAASVMVSSIRSFMCAPLWHGDVVIGVLYVDNPWAARFSEGDLDLFTALSNYAAVAIEQARLAEALFEETRRRERLQRYHSPSVVNRILEGGAGRDAELPPQERDLSVMFADLVEFTTVSERLAPRDIMALLSRFFERMTHVIFEHEGTLDKFIGDCVMAVFGAPFAQADHARRCVEAARAMRRALAVFNEEHPAVPLRMRIAINSGVAMMGDVGSPKRREFAVLGDVVNTASRLERIAAPGQILISRATWEHVKDAVPTRALGPVAIRGRVAEVELFEVGE